MKPVIPIQGSVPTGKAVGFFLGLSFFLLIVSLPTFETFLAVADQLRTEPGFTYQIKELASSMQIVLATLVLMVIWWVTEAIPLSATALLPAVVFPVFHIIGISGKNVFEFTMKNVLLNYANPVIYLFLGGFLLAASMQKWGLDRRLTLWLLTRGSIAKSSHTILLGMMVTSAILSMWISNTAATALMLPIGLGILRLMNLQPGESRYGTALMLGIAWAASIGGIGTIIGTPPNGIALGILNSTFADDPAFERITFLKWMSFGIPYVIVMIPIAWFLLLKLNPPEIHTITGGKETLLSDKEKLGKMSRGEKLAIAVFFFAVLLWISNPFWDEILPPSLAKQLSWIDEYTIGLLIGLLLFVTPTRLQKGEFLLEWRDTKFVDWGTLILFGGGIALSDAMFKTGLATWIASSFIGILGTPSTIIMLVGIIFLMDFLTEVSSNTAVTGMMVPIIISLALKTGQNPIALTVAAAVAASMAFMLPVATPPNALVYGSRFVKLKDMIRCGFLLDILGWLMTIVILYFLAGKLFGVLHF